MGPGTRLGVYEVVAAIGAGGMGEVFKARDTKLNRDVAIKILPASLTSDPDRLTRFQREAQVLAALNHPNIAAIYHVEDTSDRPAIVMELVEGETLGDRIVRGPIPIDEAMRIAKQIAEAVEAAHDRGIIHRDLKPANIKLRPDGTVKVLDFGLAKLSESNGSAAAIPNALSMSPTITSPALVSGVGVLLGTAAYMSPEQARGRSVDCRTDVWAFGCVLYEMLTGRPAFGGDTISDIIAAILRSDPNWKLLPAPPPPAVYRLLRRCLTKEPHDRLHDIADARLEIDEALGETSDVSPLNTSTTARARYTYVGAAAVAVVLAAVVSAAMSRYFTPAGPERRVTKLQIVPPAGFDPFSMALSADGRQLAFVASGSDNGPILWVRSLSDSTAKPLVGTRNAMSPFWSPDGRSLGFFSFGQLRRVNIQDGVVQVLADAPYPIGGTWSDSAIVFAPDGRSGLMRVAPSGGKAMPLTTPAAGDRGHRWPQFLPDGRHLLLFANGATEQEGGVYFTSLDDPRLTRVTAGESAAVFCPPDWLLVARQNVLTAQHLNIATGTTYGDPLAVVPVVGISDLGSRRAAFTAAGPGTLLYREGSAIQLRQFTWRDRSGRVLGHVGAADSGAPATPSLSPDGRTVAVGRVVNENNDVWLIDAVRGVSTRFTFDAANDSAPLWSRDGTRILFRSTRSRNNGSVLGANDFFEKPANGGGVETLVFHTDAPKMAYDFSPDDHMLLYGTGSPNTGSDIWVLPLGQGVQPFPVVQTPFAEDAAQFSPDGRWIVYESNESGQFEIYVRALQPNGGKWQVSVNGGTDPRWAPDGHEIFYVNRDERMTAVPMTVASDKQSLNIGSQMSLFTTRLATGPSIPAVGANARPRYAIAADGRFLLNEIVDSSTDAAPLNVILNWDAQVKR